MTVQEAIHSIIESREESRTTFLNLKADVVSAKEFCNEVNKWLSDPNWRFYAESLNTNDSSITTISSIKSDLITLRQKLELLVSSDKHKVGNLERVVNRITRGEFNFCFMGAWRQGKSFVLDKLLEMGEYIMPTSDHGATTGTVVSVRNNENPNHSEAIVTYYSVDELVKKVNDYIEYFNLNKDFIVDTSSPDLNVVREKFADACKGLTLPSMDFDGNTHKQQMFETFETLLKKVDEYKSFLGITDSTPLILKSEKDGIIEENEENLKTLRKKICFFDIDMKECFEVLAVKRVLVSKYFKIGDEEVGPIMFTDTCGIGEYRLGIDDELQNVLLCDSDIAVAVAKVPDDDTTIDKLASFHDTIAPVLQYQEPDKWVYYLINKKNNISMARSEEFKNKIENSLGKIGLYLPPTNYQIVHAANQNEIYEFILDTILVPVAKNIEKIDKVLFAKTKTDANEVIQLYKKLKSTIRDLNIPAFNANKEKEKKIVNEIFNNIRFGLQDLTNAISDTQKFDDKDLELLTDEIDIIKDSPDGYDLVNIFYPGELDKLWSKNDTTEEQIEKFINEKKSKIILTLFLKVNSQRNFTGDEFSILFQYRQQLIKSFQTRLQSINTQHVDTSLERIKNNIGNVFKSNGALSMNYLQAEEGASFYNAIITYASKENLTKLADFFKEKRDAQLTYMNSILDEIINKILLRSKFAISLNYVNDGKNIASEFYNVLLSIETNIKNDLRNYFEKEMLVETIIQHYHNMVGEIEGQLLTPSVGEHQYNELYDELLRLYVSLYEKIFPSEDLIKKDKGYKAWKELRHTLFNEEIG